MLHMFVRYFFTASKMGVHACRITVVAVGVWVGPAAEVVGEGERISVMPLQLPLSDPDDELLPSLTHFS